MVKRQVILSIAILYLTFNLAHCVWPEFYYFSRNKTNGAYFNYTSKIPANFRFNRALPTYFVIHGYQSNGSASWVNETKNELLNKLNANVFDVNWSETATSINYFAVLPNVTTCGDRIKSFITKNNITASRIHCIGHSLGAHVCGFLGKSLKSTGLSLKRISGLDPAAPGYSGAASTRLDKEDASYVDVIHTNTLAFGLSTAIGHKDFYPNRGTTQPGCEIDSTCSHHRAIELFIESIRSSCSFVSNYCGSSSYYVFSTCSGSVAYMGFNSNKTNNTGTFYLKTNPASPYCQG